MYAEQLHKEAKSYAVDQFNYSLQNIQALPYTLGRVGALTIDNKIFPFVEFYGATQEEEDALRAKLTWNGFTIGVIGHLTDFAANGGDSFVQGSLIRLEGLDEDYHCAAAIANEIHKGVYL